jgi:hypothetical protein
LISYAKTAFIQPHIRQISGQGIHTARAGVKYNVSENVSEMKKAATDISITA